MFHSSCVYMKDKTKRTFQIQYVIQVQRVGNTFCFIFLPSFPLDPWGEHHAKIDTGPIRDPCWVQPPSIDPSTPAGEERSCQLQRVIALSIKPGLPKGHLF
ncbi:hypothetical protein AMECASPLE_028063 [Ameca splendens]|uniref:Uncharacterized protein n=1 Tax=Ameca splendens TaxID=208324 RepID=A0ABV0ZG88_9TELE